MVELLMGHVAKVLNSQELIINIGSKQLVRKGMRFAVLAEHAEEIMDPVNGEVIGRLDREKVRVEVTEVHEGFAICSTYRVITIPGGLLHGVEAFGVGSMFDELYREPKSKLETFKADSRPEPLTDEQSIVKIGDRVKQLVGPERE